MILLILLILLILADLPAINFLSLSGNEAIACEDLDVLSEQFGSNVAITNPENCGVVETEPETVDAAVLFAIISLILLEDGECPTVTPETTFIGDQTISNQAGINAMQGVTQVMGSLNFLAGVTSVELDFSPLDSLVVVTQEISFETPELAAMGSFNCLTSN